MQMENKIFHFPEVTVGNTVAIFTKIPGELDFRKSSAVLRSFLQIHNLIFMHGKNIYPAGQCVKTMYQKADQADSENT